MNDEDKRTLEDRDWWRKLAVLLGWKLYAFSYRSVADFWTEKYPDGSWGGKQEVSGKMREDIINAIESWERKAREREPMSDRDQAIKEYVDTAGTSIDESLVRRWIDNQDSSLLHAYHKLVVKWVSQRERVIALERALRDLLKYCPLSGDLGVMVRCMQGGGKDAQARADRLVDHYSHLDEAQDAARAALGDH